MAIEKADAAKQRCKTDGHNVTIYPPLALAKVRAACYI
jgi:hypothetical protein